MGEMAAEALGKYLEVRPMPADQQSDDIVFLNRFGKSLSRVSMFKMIKTQALLADVRVDFCRDHAFMSQHLLYYAEVCSVLDEMCGEGVPECVR